MVNRVRKNRFQRAREPDPIALQPRDEIIVALVSEFRFLAREQLQRLLDFPCVTRINIRLRKLYDHGYLSRRFLPTVSGSPKALYVLGPRGVLIASESLNLDHRQVEKERMAVLQEKDLFLDHQTLLNETRICLTAAINNTQQMRLERWSKDHQIRLPGQEKKLRPDGYLCFFCQGKVYGFFLEVDCSTMSSDRIKSKAAAYLDYARSGLYEEDFGLRYFRVLFVAKTEVRLLNLKSAIEELTDRVFCLTTLDRLYGNPVRDRIWQRVARPGLFSLLED